jgi:hypothetical protein
MSNRTTATHLAKPKQPAADTASIDPLRARHLSLARGTIVTPEGPVEVTIDESESPLVWLACRKGRDGAPLISAVQLQAGERLRATFTRAQMSPRVSASWDTTLSRGRGGGGGGGNVADVVIAARQQVRHAMDAVGPDFAGLLLDVCCFLKGLVDIERERRWPPRSAKVVLQLALDSLARHYGLANEAKGRGHAPINAWMDIS